MAKLSCRQSFLVHIYIKMIIGFYFMSPIQPFCFKVLLLESATIYDHLYMTCNQNCKQPKHVLQGYMQSEVLMK